MIDDILAELEADTSLDVGEMFAGVTARYFESTRRGVGQVSTPCSPEELKQRFAEEFPVDGRPVSEIVERLEREVTGRREQVYHPMYMGHSDSGPASGRRVERAYRGAKKVRWLDGKSSPTLR